MSRLVIVLPLTPLQVGESFAVADWPLHITVLPPFLTHAEPTDVAAAINEAAAGQPSLTARVGHDELFGRRHDIPVSVVDDNPALTALHRTLKEAMRLFAASPEEPAFTGPGFRAHVTVKRQGRVHEGDLLTLTQIALVDMAPRAAASGRTVLATLDLAASE
ncbi:hypothetical protein GCM10022381_20600 [Leifsonia kafniensis]|uniref:2'-5' RNA ligase family protein n=1 Tax=Leifsonia kafniensis TaxID=475957 RepID=A0ABP7KHM1_9MICO